MRVGVQQHMLFNDVWQFELLNFYFKIQKIWSDNDARWIIAVTKVIVAFPPFPLEFYGNPSNAFKRNFSKIQNFMLHKKKRQVITKVSVFLISEDSLD